MFLVNKDRVVFMRNKYLDTTLERGFIIKTVSDI